MPLQIFKWPGGPQHGGVKNRRVGVGFVKSLDLGKWEVKIIIRKWSIHRGDSEAKGRLWAGAGD